MADPEVNPAGGATTDWGPTNIVTDPNASPAERLNQGLNQGGVPIIAPNGDKGWVHHSLLPKFLADNPTYERAMVFTGPDGTPGAVPASKAGEFLKQNPTYQVGLPKQTAGWNPSATSRFASVKNFEQSLPKSTANPITALSAALQIPRDAASEVGQYLRAEGESPRAAPIVSDVTSPVGEAASEFVGSQYEPKNLAMLGAFSMLPRSTAALRTLHRAIGGYFAGKSTLDAMHQADQAQQAFERGDTAEGMRQLTGAGFSTGFGVAGGKDVATDLSTNPRGVVSDLAETAKAPRDWAAEQLQESAEKQMQRVLTRGGGTKKEKAIAAKVVPEMLRRGILAGSATGMEEQSAAKAEAAGQQLEDFYKNLPQGARIPTQPLLDHFDQAKQEFISPDSGQVLDQNAIDKVDALKQVVQQFGPDVTVNDIVALRRIWDQQVAASRGGHVLPNIDESTAIDIKREAANAIRGELAQRFPDLDKINKEFSFWKNVNTVMGATNLRKGGHAALSLQDLMFGATGGGGLLTHGLGAGAEGAVAAVALSKAMKSTAWNTVSANAKSRIANLLADGNIAGAAQAATSATGGGGGAGPTGLPPSVLNQPPTPPAPASGTAQGSLQLGMPPSPTSGFPEAKVEPAPPVEGESGLTKGPLPEKYAPIAPPFANAGQPRQTPTPAEKVAPAAPETPQAAPQALTATPERLAGQKAAIEKAKAERYDLKTNKARRDELRNSAYLPELEPPEMRNVEDTRAIHQVNGQYDAESVARHKSIAAKMGVDPARAVPEGEQPVVHILGGGAASGKTAEMERSKAELPNAAIINPDFAMERDPAYQIMKKSDPLGAAHRAHEEASDVADQAARQAFENRQNIIIDKVSGNPKKLGQTIQAFKDAGYRVELRFVDRHVDDALDGMVGRFDKTGRWVPPNVLARGHEGAAEAFHANEHLADRTTLRTAPKGGGPHELVYGDKNVYNESAYKAHRGKGGSNGGTVRPEDVQSGTAQGGEDGRGLRPERRDAGENPQQRQESQAETAGQRAAAVPAQEQVAPLHVADNAPSTDKPVKLIYGGGFNPPHLGHLDALRQAVEQARAAGHNVDGIVIAPTSDKLLSKKLPNTSDRVPVEGRARMAEQTFGKEIDGVPVEVATAPAAEAEAKQGKPRRTDLADHVQQKNPNHTVINITGSDAGVPGQPGTVPALYSGEAGSNHEGYNYLGVPRRTGYSSSAIREAVKAGQPIEGMTPEAEATYREHLAKPAVSTARQDVQVEQGQRLAGHDGNETSVLTPSGNELKGRYRVVEAGDLITSHNAKTFAKNPAYPEGVQERAYHSSKEAQQRVIEQGQKFDPRYLLNTNPDTVNGPPVVTPDGTVLGGNSRAMSALRHYDAGGNFLRNRLIEQASMFGLDANKVAQMKNPMLVREVEAPSSTEELRRIGKDLNRSMTGALSTSERAVSSGKSLKSESLAEVGHIVDQLGEDATLREALGKRGAQFLDILQRDGVITARERPGISDTSTGGLNEDGKNFVEKALLGSVVDDPDLMERTPKNVLNKLGSSLGDIATMHGREDEYNLVPLLREALRTHAEAAQAGGPLEDFLKQPSLIGPQRDPVVEVLARALGGPAKSVRAALRSFAQDARADVPGQSTMLQVEKPSAVSAFNHAFHTNFSADEFHEALHDAVEKSGHPGGKI